MNKGFNKMILDKGILEIFKDFADEIEDIYWFRVDEGFTNSIDLQTDYLDHSEFYIDMLMNEYDKNLSIYF